MRGINSKKDGVDGYLVIVASSISSISKFQI